MLPFEHYVYIAANTFNENDYSNHILMSFCVATVAHMCDEHVIKIGVCYHVVLGALPLKSRDHS